MSATNIQNIIIRCSRFLVRTGATHWARIQKKVQKPPQSTHQIPGFFAQKIQKEWIVEEFSIVIFSKATKNQQKSNKRVVIPRKGVDQTMKKLTSDEL